MTLARGADLGRYQILEPLGQGGMAIVYKAFQPALDRTVALKVIRRAYAEDPEFRQRFEREAKAIARLTHSNIVQVFDYDEVDGQLFLAMQFLDGGTLKDRLTALAAEGKWIDPRDSVRILGQVAQALTYAHELGIVHRDVKPSNVMLTGKGHAVVTDFGIAKILSATSHTQTGVGMGTPEYMAPEQGQASGVDHRADIYSLGAMAYELLVGRVPYMADTPLAIVLAHIKDPLPLPSQVNPTIGKNVEKALLKALAKSPDQRYASATDFADALSSALAEDAKAGTLPTIVVRGGSAAPAGTAAQPASLTITLHSVFRQRPLLSAGVAAALLVALGGGATVLGLFGRAPTVEAPAPTQQALAAISTPATAPTSPPTAAPATPTPGPSPTSAGATPSPQATASPPPSPVTPAPTAAPQVAAVPAATPETTPILTSVPTAAPTPAATPPPTPSPPPATPAPSAALPKGALLFQARLDGTSGDVRQADINDPTKAAIAYPRGAIQMSMLASGGRIDLTLNGPDMTSFVGEFDLSVTPGSDVFVRWRLRRDFSATHFVEVSVNTRAQFVDINYVDLTVAVQRDPRESIASAPVPGLQSNPVVSFAAVVDGNLYTLYVDGKQVAQVTETRVAGWTPPRSAIDRGSGGTVRIVGWRFYQLAK